MSRCAYTAFLLTVYGAQPMASRAQVHGHKSQALVHVGSVDTPLTTSAIDAAVDECAMLQRGNCVFRLGMGNRAIRPDHRERP